MKKKKKRGCAWAFSMLLGLCSALVLGALFYGAMVYQTGGLEAEGARMQAASMDAQTGFPGPLLSLPGELTEETVRDEMVGDGVCRVVTRTYLLEGGVTATAISASGEAYLSRLAAEGFVPQLITGFSLAGLDAVCETQGQRRLLAARHGGRVYLLETQADEATLYALGAAAALK